MPSSDRVDDQLVRLLRRIADRDRPRSEATLQADVRQLLLSEALGLEEHDLDVALETQVGDRRRIDIEAGLAVIEVKRNLRSMAVLRDAQEQLSGYVASRIQQTGQRYVGILTDGAEWRAYELQAEQLVESTAYIINPRKLDLVEFLFWLEGIFGSQRDVPPTPGEIATRLGAKSSSYALDRTSLAYLYSQNSHLPTVKLKRELWASLLRSALGTQFSDDDELFIEHTLLVNTAEIIAHLVLGLDVAKLQPATLLRGQQFDAAGIYGVVEQDFFDWVLEVPNGPTFVRTLAHRIGRFDWATVEHDVLKVLYESVIGTETRERLGEYYTPDWLAERLVEETVDDPLKQRVLDPSCGSGTFLFHAVRRYLEAATREGLPLADSLEGLTNHVIGVDLHPVAVALARVTYILAIGRERLVSPDRRAITVPAYLGDSVQWQQRLDLFTEGHLVIPTDSGGQLFEAELRFPDSLLKDAARFDRLVSVLADQAAKPRRAGSTATLPAGVINRLAVTPEEQPVLEENYRLLCRLHDEGRDHIWSYYVRNLARPVWLSHYDNRVDVLIGNPPWLSYRKMPEEMQEAFRAMAQERGLWHGKALATLQDLSGLFIVRAVQQYLSNGGTFAFVVPNGVLDRGYFEGFRSGRYADPSEPVNVHFSGSWDLRRIRPHFFPRAAGVVFGRRTKDSARALPIDTVRWTGRISSGSNQWKQVASLVQREPARLAVHSADHVDSPYEPRFFQGATIGPRVLVMVESRNAGPLGLAAGQKRVRSARSSTEKPPWKKLKSLEGVIESEFVRPVLLGESIVPYRVLTPRRAVLPIEGTELLSGSDPRLDLYPNLAEWWRSAEDLWIANRTSDRFDLLQQMDFRRKLSGQLPAPSLRLVYAKSGMHAAAAIVSDPRAVIDQTLYWASVNSLEEAYYLSAIFNSPSLTDLVRPLMAYGKDERHVDKAVWKLPIPLYDHKVEEHRRLAQLGRACGEYVSQLGLDESRNFVVLRRQVRKALSGQPAAIEANDLVELLLGS